jgi:Protein of unknown function (DUF2934)
MPHTVFTSRRAKVTLRPSIDRRPVMFEEIAERAYEIYLSRGQSDGSDLEDWFQAEYELTTSLSKAS